MRLQALAIGQLGGDPAQALRAGFADLDQAAALLEVIHPQRRRETRRTAGRQDVVGAGAVVTQTLTGVSAEEDRARMLEQRFPLVRVAAADLQVLRRDAV